MATLLGWYTCILLAFVVFVMTLPTERSDSTCEGIGWGCRPDPRDEVLLVGVVLGAPVLAISLAVSIVTLAVALRRGARSGMATGTFAALTGGVVAVSAACLLGTAVF